MSDQPRAPYPDRPPLRDTEIRWQGTQDGRRVEFCPDKDPNGWIQWKGTNVCMDFTCACGKGAHIDQYFAYFILCPHCGRIYEANGYVEMIERPDLRPEDGMCLAKPEADREDA